MNQEEIIAMAREAGAMHIHKNPKEFAVVGNETIERFAALVASLVRADAIAEEREACAKVCEENWRYTANASEMAEYIRARSNT